MSQFKCKPNFKAIRICYPYLTHRNYILFIKRYFPDGIVEFPNMNELSPEKFIREFSQLLSDFDLSPHFDNLLFIIVQFLYDIDFTRYCTTMSEEEIDAAKDLSQVILLLHGNNNNISKIRISKKVGKGFDLKSDFVIEPIYNALKDFIAKMEITPFFLRNAFNLLNTGDFIVDKLHENLNLLKKVSEIKHFKNTFLDKDFKFDLCFHIKRYLKDNTDLKPEHDVMFSNTELNFYYKVLNMLGLLKEPNDPIQYMASSLRRFQKSTSLKC